VIAAPSTSALPNQEPFILQSTLKEVTQVILIFVVLDSSLRVRLVYSQGIKSKRCSLTYLLIAFPVVLVDCPSADIQMSNPAPSRLRLTHISPTKKNMQALRHLVQRTCKTKMDGRQEHTVNTGTFDFLKSIFEPLLRGRLVQTSLSVCKCRPGDVHVRARVPNYGAQYFRFRFAVHVPVHARVQPCPPMHNKSLWDSPTTP
jgi:hypothetical protein